MTVPASSEARLRALGIVLPPLTAALANYVPFVRSRNLVFLSGQIPRDTDGTLLTGTVGKDVSVEEAYRHARWAGIQMLSVVRSALGSLDRVSRVVKCLGFVNAVASFKDHPKVINGCSDLLVEVFGEAGRHARSSVGVSSLPENVTVEIEAVLEFHS